MEEREVLPNSSWGRMALSMNNKEQISRGETLIRDLQVEAGTKLSALVGFAGGRLRIIEKPSFSDAYTVLLISLSFSRLTITSIKLIATSRFTEERVLSFPSKVEIVRSEKLQINGSNTVMVKRLILSKPAMPFEFQENNRNIVQSEERHIKYIAVDQTANANIVLFVTETRKDACYLADENNRCDCSFVLAELSRVPREKPCRELNQKLQYDSTASPISNQQCSMLHICMFCGKGLVKSTVCGQVCDDTLMKQVLWNQLECKGTTSKSKPSSKKKKREKTCGCCSKRRKGKDQSEAYIVKQAADNSSVDHGTKTGGNYDSRQNYGFPKSKQYTGYTSYSELKPLAENKPPYDSKHKPVGMESNFGYMPDVNCNCEEILRRECFAANKGYVATKEFFTSDAQTDLPNENVDFYLICQAYDPKSDKNAKPKRFRMKSVDNDSKQSKKHKLESEGHKREGGETSESSAKSTTKQQSSVEELKEISLPSSESVQLVKRDNTEENKNKNVFIGRMEESSFQFSPFKNPEYFVEGQYRIFHDTFRKLPSVTSTSSSSSYLSVRRKKPKRLLFAKKLEFCKSYLIPSTKGSKMGAFPSQQ